MSLALIILTTVLMAAATGARFGMPVSTTHVSTGAILGLALRNHDGHAAVIGNIVLAWIVTLPIAAVCGYAMRIFLFS